MKNLRKLIVLFLLIMTITNCSKDDEFESKIKILKSGTNSLLNSVYFTDVNTGYVVGSSGNIMKTVDGGENWIELISGVASHLQLTSVYFTDSNNGFIVGWAGIILKTENAGVSWNRIPSGINYDLHSICFIGKDTGYIAGVGGALLKTVDSGNTWESLSTTGVYPWINSIFFTDVNTGYLAGHNESNSGIIFKTENGGRPYWEKLAVGINANYIQSVQFVNKQIGFAVGIMDESGIIIKTTDGGESWSQFENANLKMLNSVFFTNENTGYIVGYNGTILKTNDCGKTWNTLNVKIDNVLQSITFPTPNIGYAVGNNGIVVKLEIK